MIGFLRKNNNPVVAALVNNGVNNTGCSPTNGNGLGHKGGDSSSASDGSQDIGAYDSKGHDSERDDSGSRRGSGQANQKIPGLNLLQVGGIGGANKAALSTRANKNGGAFRSRNGGLLSNFYGHTTEEAKHSDSMQNTSDGSRGSPRHGLAHEGGSSEFLGGMSSFNNARGTFRKRMNALNNDGLSLREKQDLRDQLKNVKEVIDPNRSGAIFEIKNSAHYEGGQFTTTDYIPKQPVMEHLQRMEKRHQDKVALYKQYTLDLKEKYHKFEVESQRHYANIIKKHQQQTDQIISDKEDLVDQMRHAKEQSLDELNVLRARLYKAKAEGKILSMLEEEREEQIKELEEKKLIAAEQDEDLDLEKPVDVKAFEALKVYRNKLKNENIEWINKFKRAHKRDPTDIDMDEIKDQIEDYNTQNNKYILMKAKMIRQGVIPPNLIGKAKEAEAAAPSGTESAMRRTSMKFSGDAAAPANAFGSTKGFQQAFLGDPSIKKLKDDIVQKQQLNEQYEEEIQRLRYNLMDKVGADQAVQSLHQEVEIKEQQMKVKDDEIEALIDEKATIEKEKEQLRKEMEQMKIKNLLSKNISATMKRQSTVDLNQTEKSIESRKVEVEKEVTSLQEQNEKLKSQVLALQQLQRKTVYGASLVESKQEMNELSKEALSRSKISSVDVQQEEPVTTLKKEKSSESVIASFLQRNESLVQQPTEEKAEGEAEVKVEAGTPVVVESEDVQQEPEVVEGEPEVIEIPDAEKAPVQDGAVQAEEPVREVAEAGTNMTISANAAALELQRISDEMLEQARAEVTQKDEKIGRLTEQVTMLEHALADKEEDLVNEAADNISKRSDDAAQWESSKREMEEHIDELKAAIEEKLTSIEELEEQKKALQEGYEERLAEKEAELAAALKEHEDIQNALKKNIQDLQALVKDQKSTGDEKAKEHAAELARREQIMREEADERVKEKEAEIQQMREELAFNGKDIEDRRAEIDKLQVQLANQKIEEEKLLKKMEELIKEAGTAVELQEKLKDVTQEKELLMADNAAKQKDLDGVADKFREEQQKRKALLNELEDMKGKIRVYCRIRPFSRTEAGDEAKRKMCVQINDEMSLTVHGRFDQHYNFDSVFGPDSTQVQVFDETKRLIQSAVDGYNVCVFAYGQTGSGKTFTIQGDETNPGLTPRSINELYSIIGNMKQHEVQLSCYMVEIYKGELRDLLLPKNAKDRPKLEIRMTNGQVQLKNAVIKPLTTIEDTNHVFETGLGGRQVRKTLMNDESSRSHLIFSIIIDVVNKRDGRKTSGKLSFIDLAGSESSKKTGTDKEGQAEANAINQSLSALGNVISALAEGAKFIRYKENLLTKLMQDSLGGNAKTLMFVNCSPSVYNEMETKNSLAYAKRVKEIKNNPTLNLETQAMQRARKQMEAQRNVIESLKGLAQENGLEGKLAELLAGYEEEDEDHEGGSEFELAQDLGDAANQIKDSPASGRRSAGSAKLSDSGLDSARSKGHPTLKPSQSGPIKQLKN